MTKYPYLDTDTIEYQIPEGLIIESMPAMPVKIESPFGTYQAEIEMQMETGKMIYRRSLYMKKIRRPAADYELLRQFLRDVVKADKMQIVLSSKS